MENSIPISALQHYAFCPRQCGYIHIEQRWQDNHLTAQGNRLHERVHSNEAETRGNFRTERGVRVQSLKNGIHGQLDLLEIQCKPFTLIPVEYKKGKPKVTDIDRIQLCAQALCLEEMRSVVIQRAAIWYWENRKREWVELDEKLRQTTVETVLQVSSMIDSQKLPQAVKMNCCRNCSFVEECRPQLADGSLAYINRLFDQ